MGFSFGCHIKFRYVMVLNLFVLPHATHGQFLPNPPDYIVSANKYCGGQRLRDPQALAAQRSVLLSLGYNLSNSHISATVITNQASSSSAQRTLDEGARSIQIKDAVGATLIGSGNITSGATKTTPRVLYHPPADFVRLLPVFTPWTRSTETARSWEVVSTDSSAGTITLRTIQADPLGSRLTVIVEDITLNQTTQSIDSSILRQVSCHPTVDTFTVSHRYSNYIKVGTLRLPATVQTAFGPGAFNSVSLTAISQNSLSK